MSWLARWVPGDRRRGFTLIELMVVVVTIGILAAIAIVRLGATRDRTQLATLQSDLRVLATHQEIHHQYNMAYADNSAALADYQPSEVTVLEVTFASPMGWAATATHVSLPYLKCGLFWGDAPAAAGEPAVDEGVIGCTMAAVPDPD